MFKSTQKDVAFSILLITNEFLEQSLSEIKNNVSNFKSDMIEDIEQIRSKVNSVALSSEKDKKNYMTSDTVRQMLDFSIQEYLTDFAKAKDLKSFRKEIEDFKTQVNKDTTDAAFKAEEIKEQVYMKLMSNIRNEWDLRFQNVNETVANLDKGLTLKLQKFTTEVNDTVENYKQQESRIEAEVVDLRSSMAKIHSKLTELQNASSLVDTKHETGTGSKFCSNEKHHQSKDKDIEVDAEGEESYEKFRVSPVKAMDDSMQFEQHRDFKYDTNETQRMQEIEDSSMFGLTPTPQPETKGMSRTAKAAVKAADEEIKIREDQCEDMERITEHELEGRESSARREQKSASRRDPESARSPSIGSNCSSMIIKQSEDGEGECDRRSEAEYSRRSGGDYDRRSEGEYDRRSEGEYDRRCEAEGEESNEESDRFGSPAKSHNMSQMLVEESIEEMRNRSEIYDRSISIENVVDELAEIILAGETFAAIHEF